MGIDNTNEDLDPNHVAWIYSNQVQLQEIKLNLDVTWWEPKWKGSNPKAPAHKSTT